MIKGVIFLEKTFLEYYAEKMQAIPRLVFPPNVIADIEVIDITRLDQMIKTFIDTNKLLPASLTIVLANSVLFSKDILKPDPKTVIAAKSTTNQAPLAQKKGKEEEAKQEKKEDESELFLEAVPFNEVSSIRLPIPNGEKVIAANKELYTDIKRAFEKYGFIIDAVTPLLVFGNSVGVVDATIARRLLQKADMAKQHNMLNIHHVVLVKTGLSKEDPQKSSRRIYLMLGVFGLLMMVLFIMIYTTFFAPPPPVKRSTVPLSTVSPTPPITVAPTVVTVSSNSAVLAKLSVQIVESTTGSSEAASLKAALVKLGIKDITLKKGKTVSAKTIVAHAKTMDVEIKDTVDVPVLQLFPTASLIETDSQASDVIITIAKN